MRKNTRPDLGATILEIQRMSTEDGPGIRTTVFFKGCRLQCGWCHNPESISGRPQVHWLENRCLGCRTCLEVCPERALAFSGRDNRIDRDRCTGCGKCAEECPAAALELLGQWWELPDLVAEVIKDKAFFETSGGGVTLGGGEPTLQAGFCSAFLQQLREGQVHTAVDTCGMCPTKALDAILPHTDLVLYDLKEIDPRRHRRFTGSDNGKILSNLLYVRDRMRSTGRPGQLWIRTPVIPRATATAENITGIGRFIAANLDGRVGRWELCAFNNLCRDKYRRLDTAWEYRDCELLDRAVMEEMAAAAAASGVDPAIVCWSGSTRSAGGD